MPTNDNYLAVFLGSKTCPAMQSWNALSETQQKQKMSEGMAAWKGWVEEHQDAILVMGGPLGKTKKLSPSGLEDVINEMTAYCVVRADSHEAAAKMFANHPHFMIFPGESIDVMPVLPVPGA